MDASSPFFSVVMPSCNEELSVGRVIQEHITVLDKMRDDVNSWEILCLDDGSTDGTWQILLAMQAQYP